MAPASSHFDIPQATALADLISDAVRKLALVPDGDEDASRTPVLNIVAATSQLSALVRPPVQAVMEAATGYHLSAALRLVVEANVVEVIRARGTSLDDDSPPALHASEIARLCGVDSRKLARILRLLATHHIFTEAAPDVFANNRLSIALDSGAPLEDILALPAEDGANEEESTDADARRDARWQKKYGAPTPGAGLAALIGVTTDESMLHATALTDALLYPPPSSSGVYDSVAGDLAYLSELNPDDPLTAPFARSRPGAARVRQTMFDWLSAPGHTHRLTRFGCAMKGMGAMTPESAILKGFNWGALPEGSEVVDIGGGVGAAALPIVRAHPHLRLVVQDTEGVVAVAPRFWESNFPEALAQKRVSFQVQSFFEPQAPRVSPPAAFLLRMIMHNWPDVQTEQILRQIRAACPDVSDPGTPDVDEKTLTKLVIVDSILMSACREGLDAAAIASDAVSSAPEPLLANWGTANGLAYKLDIQMLNNHNAGERTLPEFTRLLARTGWRVVAVHAAHESWMPQIVAVPVPVPGIEISVPVPTSATSSPTLVTSPVLGTNIEGAKELEEEVTEKKVKRRSLWRGAFTHIRRLSSGVVVATSGH
ncbi:hypothetical protein M0805_009443 [Coniferiporia weirii]|nr:hypothetical protein M0805_009443 [Coniferiporia weirii]